MKNRNRNQKKMDACFSLQVNLLNPYVDVQFTPTIPYCSMTFSVLIIYQEQGKRQKERQSNQNQKGEQTKYDT
jgi:hypothetical protein